MKVVSIDRSRFKPDLPIFVIDIQEANRELIKKKFFEGTFT